MLKPFFSQIEFEHCIWWLQSNKKVNLFSHKSIDVLKWFKKGSQACLCVLLMRSKQNEIMFIIASGIKHNSDSNIALTKQISTQLDWVHYFFIENICMTRPAQRTDNFANVLYTEQLAISKIGKD